MKQMQSAAYGQLIDRNRALLEAHNTRVSNIVEFCRAMNQMDSELADLSERLLLGSHPIKGTPHSSPTPIKHIAKAL